MVQSRGLYRLRCLVFFCFFYNSHIQDVAAAFSTTSLTELEQNHSSRRKRPEFLGNSEEVLFCLSILTVDKTPKKVDK